MILSDRDIRRALESGRIAIDPAAGIDQRIGPDAVDFRLTHGGGEHRLVADIPLAASPRRGTG